MVDGSNIATEGRSQPSLEQLNDAVLAFMEEHPKAAVTVVVDATFGHRIAKKEVKAFDEAVANNELVTPPAGAIGRGDAFVLSIANKAGAGVLSNDSFQEFHGDYDWLFDEGRLVGGKPVPNVGWVFVSRTPVRGPKSRRAVKEAKDADPTEAKDQANRRVRAKKSAGDAPKSSRRRKRTASSAADPVEDAAAATTTEAKVAASSGSSGSASRDHVNELMPFLDFVEQHPVGTSCTAQVESYASHGAYARMGDVLIYIPLRLMDDPPPRSARAAVKIGEAIAVVIVGFTPDRRSIDAALPHMAGDVSARTADAAAASEKTPRTRTKKTPAKRTPAKKVAARKVAAKKTTTKKAAAKQAAATKTPAKKTPAKKGPAKKASAKKAAAKKTPATKAAAKKGSAKKTAAKKTAAKKTSAEQAPAKKATAKKAAAKKTTANRAAAKKTSAKRASGRKRAAADGATS